MGSDQLHRSELSFLMLGAELGKGISRTVFVLNDPYKWERYKDSGAPVPNNRESPFVIKIEAPGRWRQNVQEWAVWDWVGSEKAMAKWFAPCVSISPCGLYLIQRRVQPLRKSEMPKKLPAFLMDVHIDNLGLLDGKVVCCDYGCGVAAIRSASKRMVAVKT